MTKAQEQMKELQAALEDCKGLILNMQESMVEGNISIQSQRIFFKKVSTPIHEVAGYLDTLQHRRKRIG